MNFDKLESLINEQMNLPDYYSFKFVVKDEHKTSLLEHLVDHEVTEKTSRTGKYTSITSRKLFKSSEEIITVYKKVSRIEGIISL